MPIAPFKEGRDLLVEVGGRSLTSCYQCGLCTGVCPWNRVRNFVPRHLVHLAQLGVVDLMEGEDVWQCATCGACVACCPRGVDMVQFMRAVRRLAVQAGNIPASLRRTASSIGAVGNPWGEPREKRADWAGGLEVKHFVPGAELLLFVCCTVAFDPLEQEVARSIVRVLRRAGVEFGILGPLESCCGESIRKAGYESLFQHLASENIRTFTQAGVTKVLVMSPHCYHAFKNEYPALGGSFEVIHFADYLASLVREGRLPLAGEVRARAAYHDPCYLGRHNGIYESPREVLRAIPGLELVEFSQSRENSLCCGGGGGRIWQESKKGERLSDVRVAQAREMGVDLLVTACCYCLLNFHASLMNGGNHLTVKDLSSVVLSALAPGGG